MIPSRDVYYRQNNVLELKSGVGTETALSVNARHFE